jgi:hypothetical protein
MTTRTSARSSRRARARPERPDVDAAALPPLVDEERRDEEAAEHEECVDAEEPSRRPAHAGVIEEHAQHGEGPEPVERGLILERGAGSGARRVTRAVSGSASATAVGTHDC